MARSQPQEKKHRKNPQNFVTICSVIHVKYKEREALEKRVVSAIQMLGNPARPDLDDRLKKMTRLHFMSLHVVPGQGRFEPSYLLLEMSVDGTKEQAIADLVTHLGEALFPIYKLANCVKSKSRFERTLLDDSVEILQSMWPEFYHGSRRNGLEFSGTAGLERNDIAHDDTITAHARCIIETEIHSHADAEPAKGPDGQYLSSHKIFKTVQSRFKDGQLPEDVRLAWDEVCQTCDTPNFAEDSEAVWKQKWDAITFVKNAVPPVIYTYLGLIFLTIAAFVWVALFNENNAWMRFVSDHNSIPSLLANEIDMASDPPAFFFSPKFLLLGFAIAFASTVVIDTTINRFKRPGAVFWVAGAFALFFGANKIFAPIFRPFRDEDGIRDKIMEFFGVIGDKLIDLYHGFMTAFQSLPDMTSETAPYIGVAALAIIFALIRRSRVWIVFGLSVAVFFWLVWLVHRQFEILENPAITVVNHWPDLGLPQLAFYPMFLAGALTMAFYSAVTHAPRRIHRWAQLPLDTLARILDKLDIQTNFVAKAVAFFKTNAVYVMFFAAAFIWIFKKAFLPVPLGQTLWQQIWPFFLYALIIPLILSAAVYAVYLVTDRTLLSRKTKTKRKSPHLRSILLLTVIFSFLVNWAAILSKLGVQIISSLAIALPLTVFALALLATIIWVWLRFTEIGNEPEDLNPPVDEMAKMLAAENSSSALNHMISVQRLVPQNFRRRFTMPVSFLILLRVIKKQRYRPGFLANMGTVQYARWIHLPRTNNYIFLSNYDGSWESYLEDFITKANVGLGAAWSHCQGFPRARAIFLDGAKDGDRFKRWARRSMRATPFWYSAYPDLSSEEIRRNALIRDGLTKSDLSPSDAGAWLDLFNSIPRPEDHIQADKIQNIIFGGVTSLKFGGCLAITSDSDKPALDKWLKHVLPDVTFGNALPKTKAVYLGLSAKGLTALGLKDTLGLSKNEDEDSSEYVQFPSAFAMGMDHEARKKILRDIGNNSPDKWKWGHQEPVLATLLIYAESEEEYDAQIQKLTGTLAKFGLRLARGIKFDKMGDGFSKEPFGFADGISQPILEGTKAGTRNPQSTHLVKPGEFVLGYRDNRGYFPPSPQVRADMDTKNVLPAIPKDLPQRYPKFSDIKKSDPEPRDLGRNGSFLVIRQLEQDKSTFDRNIAEAAAYLLKLRTIMAETARHFALPPEHIGHSIRELHIDQIYKIVTAMRPKKKIGELADFKSFVKSDPKKYQALIDSLNVDIRKQRIKEIAKDESRAIADLTKDYKEREKRWKIAIPEFMIGRKEDGQSLISCPHRIKKEPGQPIDIELGTPSKNISLSADNEFLFGRDDPQGYACPYGSHVRRSNPRDGLDPASEDALDINNRHRIIRRGRNYSDPESQAKGTFFMCLNADIERQFEFIQQTWVASPKFHGLRDEVDPIVGQGIDADLIDKPDNQKFTIQAPLGDLKIGGLSSYVTLRGGGYFFLPGLDTLRFLAAE